MSRRWCVPFATLALVIGSMLAAAGASAATQAPQAHGNHAIQPGGAMIRSGGARAQVSGARHTTVTSTNWSGYASDGANGHYTKVSGAWTEPTGTCTSGNKYSSFWVGLDGYTSGSVEQTGTDVDCSGRTPQYYGWYEMYPAFPVNFSNTVRPGDHFTASVTFSGTNTFTLVLKDTTQGWTKTETKNQSGLARSSAECIVEAPSSSSGVLPLANFGTLNFTSCLSNGSAIGNQSPIQIIMQDSSGNNKDSISALSGGENFTATWLRSN
jgi:Peptidase A4 family